MKVSRLIMAVPVSLLVLTFSSYEVAASSFNAKYYKGCYEPIKKVEALVIGNLPSLLTYRRESDGMFGKFPRDAISDNAIRDALTPVVYNIVIEDVESFISHMKKLHPQPDARFVAYSNHMSDQVYGLKMVQLAVGRAQECYHTAYQKLDAAYNANIVRIGRAKDLMREIRKGTKEVDQILWRATAQMNTNIVAYNFTLKSETEALGLSLSLAGKLAGLAEKDLPEDKTYFATLARIAGFANVETEGPARLTTTGPPVGGMMSKEDKFAHKMMPSLKKAGLSSGKYLDLRDHVMHQIDTQKSLEAQISKTPW